MWVEMGKERCIGAVDSMTKGKAEVQLWGDCVDRRDRRSKDLEEWAWSCHEGLGLEPLP